jgi:hypothetical protein
MFLLLGLVLDNLVAMSALLLDGDITADIWEFCFGARSGSESAVSMLPTAVSS